MNWRNSHFGKAIKEVAEVVLPSAIIAKCRAWSRQCRSRQISEKVAQLKRDHQASQSGLDDSQMMLRDGTVIRVTPFSREMYEHFCFRDPEIVKEFDSYVKLSQGKKRLLDIGAEHGFFSIAFAQADSSNRKVLAVEPSPVAFPILAEQIELNGSLAIRPFNIAVGNKPGELDMAVRGNHVIASFDYYRDESLEHIRIPVRTVDDLCSEANFRPDLVKIDVEGFELFVLLGARETLSRLSPTLMLEIHPQLIRTIGHTTSQLIHFLDELGYEPFDAGSMKRYRLHVPADASSLRVAFRRRSK